MSQLPVSAVDICNLALDRIGQAPIASLISPSNPGEDVCARHYDQTRRELLREYIFNFARKTTTLSTNASAPVHPEFTNAFSMPIDFIRLLTLGDRVLFGGNIPTQFYDFSNGYLYCDDQTDQGLDIHGNPLPAALEMSYIYDAVLVPQFDSLFVKVLKLQLAANIAYKFTLSKSLKESLDKELEGAHLKAAAVSGQEKPPRRIQRSRIRDVRRSGGIFRNTTLIDG